MRKLLLLAICLIACGLNAQVTVHSCAGSYAEGPNGAFHCSPAVTAVKATGATITYVNYGVGNASAAAASASMNISLASGNVLAVITKADYTSLGATVAITSTGPCSGNWVQAIAPAASNVGAGGHFWVAVYTCLIPSSGAETVTATWTGTGGTFTDLAVAEYHTTTTWKNPVLDGTPGTNIASTSTTSCPTGSTTTTNNNDVIVTACEVFDNAQTWGALGGYTQRANSSRNTTGWYDQFVNATNTFSPTITLSAADYGFGVVFALASN